jgi:hypothetical protein
VLNSIKWSPVDIQPRIEYQTAAQKLQQLLRPAAGLQEGSLPHPYPCEMSASEADMAEVRLLGYHPVEVRALFRLLWNIACREHGIHVDCCVESIGM